jgi:hypothetical protein
MEKALQLLINELNARELKELFGDESHINLESVVWSTNEKKFVITTKLHVKDIEIAVEAYPEGVEYLISESWKFLGLSESFVSIVSITTI